MIRSNLSFPLKPSYADGTGKYQAEYDFLLRQSPKLEELPYSDAAGDRYYRVDRKGRVAETRLMRKLYTCLREISRLEFYSQHMQEFGECDLILSKMDASIPDLVRETERLLSM